MGLPILTNKDFTGLYKISQNCFSDLNLFIEEYEKKYLVKLLGCELADEFINDLTEPGPAPATQKFIDIFEPFCIDSDEIGLFCECSQENLESDGIKAMLKGFIYWHFTKEQKQKNTISGQVVNQNETSREANLLEAQIDLKYNAAIDSFKAIQAFINKDLTIYPNFKGQKLRKIFFGGAF